MSQEKIILQQKNITPTFPALTTRQKVIAGYIRSDEFYEAAFKAVVESLVAKSNNYVNFQSAHNIHGIMIDKSFKPYVDEVLEKLKAKIPELDHCRIESDGEIVFDTKPNTLLRRVSIGCKKIFLG